MASSVFFKKIRANHCAHGEERTKKHVVDGGKTQYFRREKYCVKHGWVDVLAIGGDAVWNRHHDSCHVIVSSDS